MKNSGLMKGICITLAMTCAAVLNASDAHASTTTTYKYDAHGRVILRTTNNNTFDGYAYDSAGNRVTNTRSSVPQATQTNQLFSGQGLVMNTSIRSTNGLYTLVLQGDGNLVVYGPSSALWSDNTYGLPTAQAVMQGDGNFVVYGPTGQVYWASNTSGHPGARIIMQDDGNLVIYATDNTPLWALSWQ